MAKKINSITVITRTWYDSYGNSYSTAKVLINGGRGFGLELRYGNADHVGEYDSLKVLLATKGWRIPNRAAFIGARISRPMWSFCDAAGINYHHEQICVNRKKDL